MLSVPRVLSQACLIAGTTYLLFAATTWLRYGTDEKGSREAGPSMDRAMPQYDTRVSRSVVVHAPVDVTFGAVLNSSLTGSPVVRALIRARELLMCGKRGQDAPSGGLIAQAKEIGWSIVAYDPNREIVMCTVTQPWKSNPRFCAVAAETFTDFSKPGYAKLIFSIGVESAAAGSCILRTETRVQTTDAQSRRLFRRYWAFVLPGVELVRIALLHQVKAQAESRWKAAHRLSEALPSRG